MPAPLERDQRYIPGLDGLRAFAVLCVIAYHLGVPWARGGLLGVGVFFTLSGYLITDLLLAHWGRYGSLGLGQFWLRRARRLLPALFVMLAAVSIWVALFDASQIAGVRRQVISSALYFANWSTIAAHGSYFGRFAAPLPLDHLWSLSIEEQFYIAWPWLLLALLAVVRGQRRMAIVTLVLAAASALLMARMYHPGYDPTRAYEGTDTRAFALLIGAALAMVWPTRIGRLSDRWSLRHPGGLDLLGVVGLVAICVLVWRTTAFSGFLYPWGMVLLSIATAAAVAAVVNPSSLLGVLLGCAPLRWIGVRSYGIYLWQWPIIVLWGPQPERVHWGRTGLEVAATFVIAALSWRLIEDPIRRGALGRLAQRPRSRLRAAKLRTRARALTGTAAAAACLAALGLIGVLPAISAGRPSAPQLSQLPTSLSARTTRHDPGQRPPPARQAVVHPLPPATRTACRSVVYIGDSTSEGEISPQYIPNPRRRLQAQLKKVGVKRPIAEISGARSIVEVYQGQPNAATVARDHISAGFHGCWILALGTNDVANVQVGSSVGLSQRIDHMMAIIGHQPVLWIDVLSLVSSGPYAEDHMQEWNDNLLRACRTHPTMRVFDWAAHAKRRWFIPDGIHYYSPGYVARAHLFARGLVKVFPEGRPASQDCLVS